MFNYAIITGFLSRTRDRFHTYNTPLTLDQKLAQVGSIPGYGGVELVYPYEIGPSAGVTAAQAAQAVTAHGLEFAAVNVNVKAEPEFVSGGITSPDPAVRRTAVRFLKEALDFAAAVGAPRVTCCPLGDGFEFVFQSDYHAAWTRLIDAFGEAAAHRPDVPLMIEYKPKETRRRCFLNRAADTLLLIREIGAASLGITIDYGHAIYADEHPAEVLSLLHYSGQPYYIHINDNDKSWDWDFFTGSHTLMEYIEFVYYLMEFGYQDFLTSDTHPTRLSPSGMFEVNARLTEKIAKRIDAIGLPNVKKRIEARDYLETWRFVESELLGFGQ